MNEVARSLTGWTIAEAQGQPLERVFNIINEQTREPVENPALRAIREGRIFGLANHSLLIPKGGNLYYEHSMRGYRTQYHSNLRAAISARKQNTHRTTCPDAPLKSKPNPLNSIAPAVYLRSTTTHIDISAAIGTKNRAAK